MDYYLGGYYLVKLKPIDFGSYTGEIAFTASQCINDQPSGYWAYPWEKAARKNSADAEETFNLNKPNIDKIREWVGAKIESGLIGWSGVFVDVQTAVEYRDAFFSHVDDVLLLAIYFSESERAAIIGDSETFGDIGIYQTLLKQSLEADNSKESLLGFDLIGIECDGDFHSFHCHEMSDELSKKFGLVLNQFGLFDEVSDWQSILDYMNDEETGCEPVPWIVSKVKLVDLKD